MRTGFLLILIVRSLIELFAVNVGHCFALHTRIEIESKDAFDLRLFKPMHLKALSGDFALNSVCGFKYQFFFLPFEPGNKEKLTGSCHLYLNGIEEVNVLFDEFPDLCIFLNFKAFGQIGFVIVKAFGRVGADDLNVG